MLTIKEVPIVFSSISILYEALCLLLTVGKTLQTYRRGRLTGMNAPLSKLLLRDGMLLYGWPMSAQVWSSSLNLRCQVRYTLRKSIELRCQHGLLSLNRDLRAVITESSVHSLFLMSRRDWLVNTAVNA